MNTPPTRPKIGASSGADEGVGERDEDVGGGVGRPAGGVEDERGRGEGDGGGGRARTPASTPSRAVSSAPGRRPARAARRSPSRLSSTANRPTRAARDAMAIGAMVAPCTSGMAKLRARLPAVLGDGQGDRLVRGDGVGGDDEHHRHDDEQHPQGGVAAGVAPGGRSRRPVELRPAAGPRCGGGCARVRCGCARRRAPRRRRPRRAVQSEAQPRSPGRPPCRRAGRPSTGSRSGWAGTRVAAGRRRPWRGRRRRRGSRRTAR